MGREMGRIHIQEAKSEWEIASERVDGVVELQIKGDEALEVVVSDDSPYSADDIVITEREMGDESPLGSTGPLWLLYVPSLLGILALAFDQLAILSRLGSPVTWGAVLGLYVSFALFAVVGTLSLYNDAKALQRTGREWQPNPWRYIVGGAVGVAAIQLLLSGVPTVSLLTTIPYLGGLLIVGGALAASVTGPIYFRNRRVLLDAESGYNESEMGLSEYEDGEGAEDEDTHEDGREQEERTA